MLNVGLLTPVNRLYPCGVGKAESGGLSFTIGAGLGVVKVDANRSFVIADIQD